MRNNDRSSDADILKEFVVEKRFASVMQNFEPVNGFERKLVHGVMKKSKDE